MVYLLKMVIFYSYVNQRVLDLMSWSTQMHTNAHETPLVLAWIAAWYNKHLDGAGACHFPAHTYCWIMEIGEFEFRKEKWPKMQLKKQTHRGKGACSLFVQQVCTNAGSNPRANGWNEFRVGDVTEYDLGCVSALHLEWLDGHGQPGIPFQSDPYALRHHIVTPTKKHTHSSIAP